ncbi:MAG: anhydro-N-acetylmuramic acid kinase [Actinomycetales bacterium]|nr:anhydro-N-acetylmuramic acid kinase [Actinomycetales bacterium]
MRVLALSSGTSVDAIDVALADVSDADGVVTLRTLHAAERPWPADLRRRILAALPPAPVGMGEVCALDTLIGQAFGDVGAWAIGAWGDVDLVASHGQTVFHWVEGGQVRGTLQLGSAARVAALTGRPVVHDLRSSDIAHGGHGAPLVSLLDLLWLADRPTAAVNIGGIANVTLVGTGTGTGAGAVRAGDTGPGNCLIDVAAAALTGEPYDADGAIARTGSVDARALDALLADPFYALPLPKSTGRELFHAGYVADVLAAAGVDVPAGADLLATLTELTAVTIASHTGGVERVVVSGGGVRNSALMDALRRHASGISTSGVSTSGVSTSDVITSDELGLPSDAKEAYLFTLLGYLSVRALPGTAEGPGGRRATGARDAVVLGSLTPPAPAPCAPASAPVHRLIVEEGTA